jgi:hypothetical protein
LLKKLLLSGAALAPFFMSGAALAQTPYQLQLATGNPSCLQLRDRASTYANMGCVDSTTHVFTPSNPPSSITSSMLASGAAAGNVGTLSGVLSGTLPSAAFASGAAASLNFIVPGTGGLSRGLQARGQNVVYLSDYCVSGAADATACGQNAINRVAALGQAELSIDPGTWNFLGALSVISSGVSISCQNNQQILNFTNGGSDDFVIGYQASQIAHVTIKDCYLFHAGKTGGISVNIKNAYDVMLDHVLIDSPWQGVYAEKFNTLTFQNTLVTQVKSNSFAYRLYANPSSSDRSDVATFYNSTATCGYTTNGTGLSVDGMVQTVRVFGLNLLACNYGMFVDNSAVSATNYPAFFEMHDLEVDGAKTNAVVINGGSNFSCVNCDISNTSGATGQGNADGPSLVVNPDLTGSHTHQITFSGGRISNSRQQAMSINARDAMFSGVLFTDASKAGSGSFPSIHVGANSDNIQFIGGSSGALYGVTARTTYGLQVDAGATAITAVGMTFPGNVTGPFQFNNTSDTTSGSATLTLAH